MPTTTSRSSRARTSRRLVATAVASSALIGGLLIAPAGAQTGPSATAEASCEDGAGVIEVTITDPTESFVFDVYIDDELVAEEVDPGVIGMDGIENGTYEVGVDAIDAADDVIEVLTTDVTVDCAAAPTTTTTTPVPTTTEAPAPATAPAAAARPAASLEFTG